MRTRLKKFRGQPRFDFGSRITAFPSLRMETSSPSKRKSLGSRTACDPPVVNNFAVSMRSYSRYIMPAMQLHYHRRLSARGRIGVYRNFQLRLGFGGDRFPAPATGDALETGAIGSKIDQFGNAQFQRASAVGEKKQKQAIRNDEPKIDMGNIDLPINQKTQRQ